MYNPETELIFPPRCIGLLGNDRGIEWQELVSSVENTRQESTEIMGFVLMMTRLNNCITCNADSFRAIHGCTICSKQSLKRFHGSDHELCNLFETTLTEVIVFIQNRSIPQATNSTIQR
jgi:hypothetical protein